MTDQDLINKVKASIGSDRHLKADLATELLSNYVKSIEDNAELHKLLAKDRMFVCNNAK